MPRSKYNTRNNSEGGDSDEPTDTVVDTPTLAGGATNVITMSEEQLSSIFTNIARTQAEANKALIESLVSNMHAYSASTPIRRTPCPDASAADAGAPAASPSLYAHHAGSFAKCTARFSGAADEKDSAEILEAFLDAVETFKDCTNVSDYHALKGLPMLLTGDAAVWWQGVKATTATWVEAVAALRGMYGAPRPAYKIFKEIFATEQCSERAEIIITRVRSLISKLPYGLSECVQLDIVYGLLHRRIRKRLPRDSVTSMDALILKARSVEETIAEIGVSEPITKIGTKTSHLSNVDSNSNISLSKTNTACRAPVENSKSKRSNNRPRCTYCHVFGHSVAECRKAGTKQQISSNSGKVDNPNTSNNNNTRAVTNSDASTLRCYGCGQPGVIRSRCSNCKTNESQSAKSADFNTVHIEYKNIPRHAIGDVNTSPAGICNPSTAENTYVCSGNVNTSSAEIFNPLPPDNNTNVRNVIHFNTLHADDVNPLATKNANVIRDIKLNTLCTVDVSHPMVDISILGKQGVATLDTGASHSLASPALHKVLSTHGVQFVPTKSTITLADGSRREQDVLTARVDVTIMGRSTPTDFIILPEMNPRTLLGRDFIISLGIVLDVPGGVWYFSDAPACKYTFVQTYVMAEDAGLMHADVELYSLRSDEGQKLTPEQRSVLNEFILEHTDRFAIEGPATEFAVHRIKVSDDQEPIACQPYRLPQTKKEALKKELEKLLDADIIEECESPWAANVVLVPKKDGGMRLCIDYRKLNAVTEPDRYPLPRMEDILHAAKRTNYMTTLDLRSGYFHVSVHPDDRDKTAFISPVGTFRFKRMPMGLRNSGATFQRLIDRFKSNLKGVTLWGYLDDLIVLSETFEQHLQDLKVVFDRLAMFKLRVNREKTFFAKDSVRFLGHVIVPGGIHMDPGKTDAILAMLPPQNLKHLQCFLQTTSWFRRFIPGYAEIARPLTNLLKKVSRWQWGTEQQAAFEQLKELLSSAPILRQADENQPFVLRTDSSGYALGAALLQGEGTDERPIEYASRLLTAAERNYSTTEREALAVVWAVAKFRGYIDGATVIVKSDHQPLRWLMSMRSPSGRLARWALSLQEYNLKIEYTPGKANVLADTLSRPTCADGQDCDLRLATVDLPSRSPTDVRENQMKDPDVRKIIEAMESDDPFRGRLWSDRGYVMTDSVLYRYCPENEENDDASLVVPDHERNSVLIEYHDAPTAGHFGVERTLNRIAGKYYWPNMRASVSEYIKNCVSCQRYKVDTRKPAGLLQTPAATRRFEVLAVDLFGPLPETANGNKWILILEDTCTKWVEIFALSQATSEECAKILISEVFLRFGVPRRVISDNGVQFISGVMQQVCHSFGISQSLTPVYHPEANPVERKNRDLKPQLAVLVGQDHNTWDTHLGAIRFAMNSATTSSTGYSPAFLMFGRELRAPADVLSDMRSIIENDCVATSISQYLKRLTTALLGARDVHEEAQARRNKYADEHRRPAPDYQVGDLVLLKTQGVNDTGRGQTPKLIPRRDGPYRIRDIVSETTYMLERCRDKSILGKYHVSVLTPFVGDAEVPIQEKRRRGRPRKY